MIISGKLQLFFCGLIFLSAIICIVELVLHYPDFLLFHDPGRVYMVYGSSLSALCCAFVILANVFGNVKYQKHPNVLLFWKSIADLVLALRFIIPFDEHVSLQGCLALAAFSQFFAIVGESYFFSISVDLWFCATNPFLSVKSNLRLYHGGSWGLAVVTSLLIYISRFEFHPSQGDSCWFGDADLPTAWFLYYGIVVCFVIGSVLILFLEQNSHPAGGMKQTLDTRQNVIHSIRMTTLAYSIYQTIVIMFWIIDVNAESRTIENMSALFHGSKGFVNLIAWVAINGIPHRPFLKSSEDSKHSSIDEVLEPQLNIALRQEVLHFTTCGIIAAASHAEKLKRHCKVVKLRIHDFGMKIRFNDYEPLCFKEMRTGFGLSTETYSKCFIATCHERLRSGGGSGAFMFYTADYSFVVKSITKSERRVLLKMMPTYTSHMKRNPGSHLTRYFGCHSIHMYGKSFSFVVMSNVIGKYSMHEFYDIKGSWINRHAEATMPGEKLICTYCSQIFESGSHAICDYSIHGSHMPHIVLKDNDFRANLRLEPKLAYSLMDQICIDTDFLCSQGIMDYSLLLSLHSTKYDIVSTGPSRLTAVPSKRKVNYFSIDKEKRNFVVESSSNEASKGDTLPLISEKQKSYHSIEPHTKPDHSWGGERSFIKDGYSANVIVFYDYYQIGLIDMLQTWTWRKKVENFWKRFFLCLDGRGISAVPPRTYALRFQKRMRLILLGNRQS